MSDIAIRVENLSKLYRIGERERYYTLRDTLANAFTTPFRWLRQAVDGRRPTEDRSLGLRSPVTGRNGHIWALKDVSFEVKRGEVVGVIGRNGAGKTTLLKILSRITEPTEGYVELHGRVGSLLEVGTGFHPELTGRENIYLNGAILGMKKTEIDRKFDEIVAFAEVEKFIDASVKHYSSGMSMRLAFAVAAHLEPEILLVDEVLAVGDQAFQKKCLGKMDQVHQEGRTVLLVNHNMTPILQLCSKVIWLDSGKIAEQGDTRSVVSHYLRDNRISLGEAVFDLSGGANGATLVRACVMDDSLCTRPDIPYAKPFYLAIEYHVECLIDGLRVGLRLHNERNLAVLHAATSDRSSLDGEVGKPGRHRARVKIPGAWLAPGRYYAEVGIWSPKVGHHQHVLDALAFDITDVSVGSVGEEILRPILDWTVE